MVRHDKFIAGVCVCFFFFNDTATTEIYTLSLHDALPISAADYVLALFDNPSMVQAAIANYRNVVEGREDNPYIRPFRDRLEQLRSR